MGRIVAALRMMGPDMKEEIVERRIREHKAEIAVVRSHGIGQTVRLSFEQNDRPAHVAKHLFFGSRNMAELTDYCDVRRHHGKRLVPPSLFFSEQPDGLSIFGIAAEMESSKPFYRDNCPPS